MEDYVIVIATNVAKFGDICSLDSVGKLAEENCNILMYDESENGFKILENNSTTGRIFLVYDETDSASLKEQFENIGINLKEAILLFHKETSDDIKKLFSDDMSVLSHHIENEVYAQVGKDLAQGGENVYENVYNHLLAALRTQLNNETRKGKNNSTASPEMES